MTVKKLVQYSFLTLLAVAGLMGFGVGNGVQVSAAYPVCSTKDAGCAGGISNASHCKDVTEVFPGAQPALQCIPDSIWNETQCAPNTPKQAGESCQYYDRNTQNFVTSKCVLNQPFCQRPEAANDASCQDKPDFQACTVPGGSNGAGRCLAKACVAANDSKIVNFCGGKTDGAICQSTPPTADNTQANKCLKNVCVTNAQYLQGKQCAAKDDPCTLSGGIAGGGRCNSSLQCVAAAPILAAQCVGKSNNDSFPCFINASSTTKDGICTDNKCTTANEAIGSNKCDGSGRYAAVKGAPCSTDGTNSGNGYCAPATNSSTLICIPKSAYLNINCQGTTDSSKTQCQLPEDNVSPSDFIGGKPEAKYTGICKNSACVKDTRFENQPEQNKSPDAVNINSGKFATNIANGLQPGEICAEFSDKNLPEIPTRATNGNGKGVENEYYQNQKGLADNATRCVACKNVVKGGFVTGAQFYKLFALGNFIPVVPAQCVDQLPLNLLIFVIMRVYSFIAALALSLIILAMVIISLRWVANGVGSKEAYNVKTNITNLTIALATILIISTLIFELLRAIGINEAALTLR